MYSEEYKNYERQEFNNRIEQEMVADVLGEKLGNQEFINNLTSTDRNIAQKIYSWIVDKLNKINKLTGYKFEKIYWTDVKNKFDTAFNSEFNNNDGGTKFALERTSDGIEFVRSEEGKFIHKDGTKMSPLEVYNSLVGKEIDLGDGDTIYILKRLKGNKNLYDELFKRYPKFFKNIDDVKALNESVNYNIEELLQNSEAKIKNQPDVNNRHQKNDIKTFDTRNVNFYDGKNAYTITFSIAKLADGKKVAYAKKMFELNNELLNKIKADETMGQNSQLNHQPLLNNIIPSNQKYVNNEKNNQKYSQITTGAYQKFLKDNFSNNGTKTYMKDVLVPVKENKTAIPISEEIESTKRPNIIDEKVAEYIKSVKDNFESNIDISTKAVNDGNAVPIDYKNEKETTIYKRARDIFKKIGKKVFTNKNDSEKIYVSNTDINESIRKTMTNLEQKKYLDENMAVFSQLDKIIENGKEISGSIEDTKGREYKDYKYYVTNVRINSENFVVEFDTRVEEHNKNHERHLRLERVYKVEEGDLVTGADEKSPNQFVPKSPSINNIIPRGENYVNNAENNQKSVKKIQSDDINAFIKEENNQMQNSLFELKKVAPIKEKTKTAIPIAKNIKEMSNLTNNNSIDYNISESIGDKNGRQRESDSRSIRKTKEYNERRGSKSNITNFKREGIDSRYGKDNISQKAIDEVLKDKNAKKNVIEYAKRNNINKLSTDLSKLNKEAQKLGINLVLFNGKNGNEYIGLMKENEMYLDLNENNLYLEDGTLKDRFYHEVFHYLKRNTSFDNEIKEIQYNILKNNKETINRYIEKKGYNVDDFSEEVKAIITEEILDDYCAKHISGYDVDYGLPEEITYSLNQIIEDALVELKVNKGNIIKKDNKIDTNTFVKRQNIAVPISKDIRLKKDIELFNKAKGNISRDVIKNIANSLDIKVKNGAQKIQNTNMESLSGKNKNPKIISIDNIFEGVDSKNVKSFRGKAISKALELFRDKKVNIKDTGTIAEINKHGIEKTYSGNITPEKIQTTNNIENIIEEGIYLYTTQSEEDINKILYHHFFTPVNYNDKNGLIRVVIKEFTKDSSINDKYYYHQIEFISDSIKREGENLSYTTAAGSKTGDSSPSINNIIPKDNNYVNSAKNSQKSTKVNKLTANAPFSS